MEENKENRIDIDPEYSSGSFYVIFTNHRSIAVITSRVSGRGNRIGPVFPSFRLSVRQRSDIRT